MMDEYISKQKVLDYLNGYLHSLGNGNIDALFDRGQRRALINSIQDISVVKAADVQPVKHGRWKVRTQKDGTTIGQHNVTYCSECGYVIFTKENSFCARCGARMDGDSDGQ
jgi:DNA-directed RNA polymerase subunit RPC12/RpoP